MSEQAVRTALSGLVDSATFIATPFAVAYGVDALPHSFVIDIGARTTDLCVTRGRYPTEDEQRTLTYAGDWIDEQLLTWLRARQPEARLSPAMVCDWKEQWSFVGEPKKPVMARVVLRAGRAISLDMGTGASRESSRG